MGVVWLGVIAHRQPRLFGRLVRALDPLPVIAHIDRDSPLEDFERAVRDHWDRVSFVRERIRVAWAGISSVRAMLAIADSALQLPEFRRGGRLVYLSGSCYPTVAVDDLLQFFDRHPAGQYVSAIPIQPSSKEHSWKIQSRHHWELQRFLWSHGVPKSIARFSRASLDVAARGLPSSSGKRHVYVGSQWLSLTGECLADVRGELESNALRLRHCFAPDEMVFQTTIHTSEWKSAIVSRLPSNQLTRDLRPAELSNYHFMDVSMCKTLDERDVPDIYSSDMPFIRKIDSPYSDLLLDVLDLRRRSHELSNPLQSR